MNPRKQLKPQPQPKPGPSKHYWHRYHNWPYHEWYDYDDCDYCDWDYDYDYDHTDWDFYSTPKKPTGPKRAKAWVAPSDDRMMAYHQGFKDGWIAAMEYIATGEKPTPEPIVPVSPTKSEETPE